jgi:hypothetical protein
MIVGAYEQLNGRFPLYILQFDKGGFPKSAKTESLLLDEIGRGAYTHVYLFSHGWNNDFGDAISLYRGFFNLFLQLRSQSLFGNRSSLRIPDEVLDLRSVRPAVRGERGAAAFLPHLRG